MKHQYYLADVFTDKVFGGNPLAVFPNAERLRPELMPLLARELNISECAFAFPPSDSSHELKLRIFTPTRELPFAGHPTVGTACVLAETGRIQTRDGKTSITFEEAVGPIQITISTESGKPTAKFSVAQLPEFGPPAPPAQDIANMLGLSPDILLTNLLPPTAVSCGVPYMFIEIPSAKHLAQVQLDLALWRKILANFWAPHVYVIARDSNPEIVYARMFAPALGIQEDPATGAAASALAGLLGMADREIDKRFRWKIHQGVEMGRPSLIEVDANKQNGKITEVLVGGGSVLVGRGEFELS
ncbi:MAG: PhzF family phenazine biosynthesis protein [Ignavibacteriae bacterium]|nr:PhzF family phenazine biosynthesis protein [Ignavibacteriota bacterium]